MLGPELTDSTGLVLQPVYRMPYVHRPSARVTGKPLPPAIDVASEALNPSPQAFAANTSFPEPSDQPWVLFFVS